MKRMLRFSALTSLLFISLLFLFSCSYGIFNFSAETGYFRFELEFNGDYSASEVEFTLTPPDDSGDVIFTEVIENGFCSLNVENMDIGTWELNVTILPDSNTVFESSVDFEIVTDQQTGGRIDVSFNGSEYSYNVYWWDSDGTDISSAEAAITVDSLTLSPLILKAYRGNTKLGYAAFEVSGTNFLDGLNYLEITSPDDSTVRVSNYEYYPKDLFLGGSDVEETLISIQDGFNRDFDAFNGTYTVRAVDNSSNIVRFTYDYDLVSEDKIPVLTGMDGAGVIATLVDSTIIHDFDWEIPDSTSTGSVFAYIVNKTDGTYYPADDSIYNSTGVLSVPNSTMSVSDTYQLVVVSMEYSTTTPYTDAIAAGVDIHMNATTIGWMLNEIYGASAGLISVTAAEFDTY